MATVSPRTQRAYDAVSRLSALTDPRGLTTLFRYDGLNRVLAIADARQRITRFSYDAKGNLLTSTEQAIAAMTTFTYEPTFNQVASIKDPKDNTTPSPTTAAGCCSRPLMP